MMMEFVIVEPDGTEHEVLATSPRAAIRHVAPHARYPRAQDQGAPRWTVRLASRAERPCWAFVA
jgi:hypothetical protein